MSAKVVSVGVGSERRDTLEENNTLRGGGGHEGVPSPPAHARTLGGIIECPFFLAPTLCNAHFPLTISAPELELGEFPEKKRTETLDPTLLLDITDESGSWHLQTCSFLCNFLKEPFVNLSHRLMPLTPKSEATYAESPRRYAPVSVAR